MKKDAGVPLYIITGFLGSGKTTLLNRALEEASARGLKIGVIINEWGQVSIDASLVPQDSGQIELKELNDGQIFCSCLAADFIKALQLFSERDLDAAIVETSGMANPFPLKKMLADLEAVTGDHFDFRGMTALVDPENFLELLDVINAVREQVLASNRVIINKIDLATQEEIRATREKIVEINPAAEIIETTMADIGDFFSDPKIKPCGGKKFGLQAFATPTPAYPRPLNHVLFWDQPVEITKVMEFMRGILPEVLRIKGIIEGTDGAVHYVDGVNDKVEERDIKSKASGAKIVIIPKRGESVALQAAEMWEAMFGAKPQLS